MKLCTNISYYSLVHHFGRHSSYHRLNEQGKCCFVQVQSTIMLICVDLLICWFVLICVDLFRCKARSSTQSLSRWLNCTAALIRRHTSGVTVFLPQRSGYFLASPDAQEVTWVTDSLTDSSLADGVLATTFRLLFGKLLWFLNFQCCSTYHCHCTKIPKI
jgi:hypothetical protein